jgi:hypothetical protein
MRPGRVPSPEPGAKIPSKPPDVPESAIRFGEYVTFRVSADKPLIVYACHCLDCRILNRNAAAPGMLFLRPGC